MKAEQRFVEGNLATHRLKPELGVGKVVWANEAGRAATVEFAGLPQMVRWEQLQHHTLDPGDRVFSIPEGMFGVVHHRVQQGDTYFYLIDFPFGRRGKPEADLEIGIAQDPLERLREGTNLDDPLDFDLRAQATRLRLAYAYDDRVCLSNTRIELKYHHQIFVAHRVLQGYKPRFILADEVGLGKTIEAGLILKELRARGLVTRALIIAPANLTRQWANEMRTKFNERFTVYDGPTVRFLEREHPGANVWSLNDNVICSLQYARRPPRREAIATAGWDIVIVDEAHHVRRYLEAGGDTRLTQAYHLGSALQDKTDAMLFLTATPMQLHPFELFSLVELLDPTLFPTYSVFEHHRQHEIGWFNDLISHLREYEGLLQREKLQVIDGVRAALQRSGEADLVSKVDQEGFLGIPENRAAVIDGLTRLHILSRVMIRNRKRVVGGFTEREARVIPVELTEAEYIAYQRVTDWVREEYSQAMATANNAVGFAMVIFQQLLTSSRYALMESLNRRIEGIQARYVESLEELALGGGATVEEDEILAENEADDVLREVPTETSLRTAVLDQSQSAIRAELAAMRELLDELKQIEVDSKAVALQEAIDEIFSRNPNEKVLVFTRFLDTQEYLRRLLSKRYQVTIFNGGLNQEDKEKAVDNFRHRAQVMISSEAGGEGRNLQFCHIMFNYDLPWNPMRIEQRIGRLDRIGQRKNVYIYNFSIVGTVEERILSALQRRIRLFEETVGGLDPILGTVERDLRRLIMEQAEDFDREFDKFELAIEERIRKAREMEAKMSDFIMDTQSFHKETVLALLGRQPPVTWQDLKEFIRRFIGRYPHGVFTETAGNVVEIEVPRAFQRHYGDLPSTFVGTFDPATAIQRETLDFFAFGHPLVDAVVHFATSPQLGGYATVRRVAGTVDEPTACLQLNYKARFTGIKPIEEVICLAYDGDGQLRPDLAEALGDSWSEQIDLADRPSAMRDFPLEGCLAAAESVLLEMLVDTQRKLRERSEAVHEEEAAKIDTVYRLRIQKVEGRMTADNELLGRLHGSSDEGERRIIPAIEGRITTAQRAIEDLEAERKDKLRELDRRRRVDFDFELLNAALVQLGA
jgi:SNF2 family DNA or RNA helicase